MDKEKPRYVLLRKGAHQTFWGLYNQNPSKNSGMKITILMIDMMPKKYSPANNKLRSYLQGATKVSSGGLEAIFVWPSR